MKGVIKEGILILLSVIVMLLLLGFSYEWTVKAANPEQWEDVWELGEEKTGVPTEPSGDFPIPPNPFGDIEAIEVDRPISDSDGPHRLSEVACSIAEDIFEDFKRNGNDGVRTNCARGRPSNHNQCLIGVGTFKYQRGTTNPPASWEIDLTNDYPDCHVCPIEDFDEVCINYNLKDRTSGSEKLCDGVFTTDQGSARFGNCNCGDQRNSDAWDDQCDGWWCILGTCPPGSLTPCANRWCNCGNDYIDDACDNDEDIIAWIADRAESGAEGWKVKDNYETDNSVILSEGYEYIYGVFWVPDDERYRVLFYRLPEIGNKNSFDFISELLDWDDDFYRINAIGNHYKEARTIADVVVELDNDITVQVLKEEIEDTTYLKILEDEIRCEECTGESCIPEKPQYLTKRKCGDGYIATGEMYFLDEPITIYMDTSDPNGCTGQFSKDKYYRVIIQNWWGKYESSGESCYEGYQRSISIIETSSGTCATNFGGICERPSDCTSPSTCVCSNCLDCTTYPALCCCV